MAFRDSFVSHLAGMRDGDPADVQRAHIALDRAAAGWARRDHARQRPSVMRAAGMRLFDMRPERLRALAGNRQPWQALAWQYRDSIGELRYATQFRARAISRVAFFAAQVDPGQDEPLPLSLRDEKDDDGKPTEKAAKITVRADLCTAAEEELARLPFDDGYSFTGVWSENQDIAGDCWMHGYRDPDTDQETWRIRSVMDVEVQGSTMTIKDELGQPRRLDLGTREDPGPEEIHRLWVPHPAHGHLADSAVNALMTVLEGIILTDREMRAISRSRIANNGAWLVPNGMTQLRNVKSDSDNPDDGDAFMTAVTAAFMAPIANEGDPGGVVPAIFTGSREDVEIASRTFLRFDRPDAPALLDKLDKGLTRMANGLDIPPEIITGMASVNHWTAWQIDAATFRHHLEPSIRLMCDSITVSFLRSALIARGFPPQEVAKVRVWYDAGAITENPNRRQDALDALDRILIGPAAGREALGFSPADAPTPEEALQLIAAKAGIDQATAAALIAHFARQDGQAPDLPAQIGAPVQQAQIPAPRAERDDSAPGGDGPPQTAPSNITAATAPPPAYTLDNKTGAAIAALERALRDDLLAAADAETTRALERAGSRLKAKTTARADLFATLRAHPAVEWPARIGQDQALALGADARFLLAQAWDRLAATFRRKTEYTIREIARRVAARLLGLTGGEQDRAEDRMVDAMTARLDTAWANLRAGLEVNAEQLMFGRAEDPEHGEIPDLSVPPALVRDALSVVGGLPTTSAGSDRGRTAEPATGLLTGATVTGELDAAGVLPVGYVWVYGITPQARKFPPHWELEGERFTSWLDPKLSPDPRYRFVGAFYHPGDHRGCMCDYVPAYALPAYAGQVRQRLRIPSPPTQQLLDLAADDDRAGRTGTTAQEIRDQWQAVQDLQARFLADDTDLRRTA